MATSLTLSFGGVDFILSPSSDLDGIKIEKTNDEILLRLTSFSGTLRVASKVHQPPTSSPTSASKTAEQITPKASNTMNQDLGAQKRRVEEHPVVQEETVTSSKKARKEERCDDAMMMETSQPTLLASPSRDEHDDFLGQPDFSQTQSQFSSVEHTEDSRSNTTAPAPPTSRVQKLMENAASSQPTVQDEEEGDDDDEEEASHRDRMQTEPSSSATVVEETVVKPPVPARVSLGASPSPKKPEQDGPSPRWGHTMTSIGENRLLVYGGQSFGAKGPATMNDVFVYDTAKKGWFKPFNCDGIPRQWHTASYLPEKQLLVAFGGEAGNPKTNKVKTTSELTVLDTEIMLWFNPSVSGDIPSGRSGHSATVLSTNEVVVFGGVKGSKWLNSVSVLDTVRWKWETPKIQGSAPKPRSYHSATAVKDCIVIFGGNDAGDSFNSVHVLQTKSDSGTGKWTWTNPTVTGYAPKARTGHSAVLLADGKTICIYGGWDPNADEEVNSVDDAHMFFDDCYFLDTEKWSWRKGPKVNFVDAGSEKRVGHQVALVDGGELLVYGGRIPGDRFIGDFQSIIVDKISPK